MLTKYTEPIAESFSDTLLRIFPNEFSSVDNILNLTFQVTENCCMACSYCYQHNKSNNKMDFKTAKTIIDNLLNTNNKYHTENIKGIVLEFIGGEPLLEIELIDRIITYFINECIRLNHRFLHRFKISMTSNGLLYFTDSVQNFIKKYKDKLSYTITIDGNKQLHDACRFDLDGNGTYDRVVSAVTHLRNNYIPTLNTKMTLSPDNIHYTFEAIKNLIELNYQFIFLNCVFEEGWELKHAKILYNEMKKTADWLFENDSFKKYKISIFEENSFISLPETETNNWCGGVCNGMLAFDYNGKAFPCIRYMGSSLNGHQEPYSVGDIDGLFITEEDQNKLKLLESITRQSQSTQECLECPIASGCAWCSGYNYEVFGTPNKRATFICIMHKARSLANSYYYNKGYLLSGLEKRIPVNLPKEEALKIIDINEWNMLQELEKNV